MSKEVSSLYNTLVKLIEDLLMREDKPRKLWIEEVKIIIINLNDWEDLNREKNNTAIRTTITVEKMTEWGLIKSKEINHLKGILIIIRTNIIEMIEIISLKKATERIVGIRIRLNKESITQYEFQF
jgi:hypothetical protein